MTISPLAMQEHRTWERGSDRKESVAREAEEGVGAGAVAGDNRDLMPGRGEIFGKVGQKPGGARGIGVEDAVNEEDFHEGERCVEIKTRMTGKTGMTGRKDKADRDDRSEYEKSG
jgi:hypothetical protein